MGGSWEAGGRNEIMTILEVYEDSGRHARRVTSNEYAGPCPVCGGEDRLLLWLKSRDSKRYPVGNFFCRQCHASGGPEKLAMLLATAKGEYKPAVRRSFPKSVLIPTTKVEPVPPAIKDENYLNIVRCAQRCLTHSTHRMQAQIFLRSRGITLETALKHGLGYIERNNPYKPLRAKEYKPRLPVGLLIPSYRDGELRSIKVRAMDGDESNNSGNYAKYRELADCPAMPYILKANSNGNTPLLIVESELDAILLEQFGGSLFNYIGLGSASAKADAGVADMIDRARRVIFLPDYDDAGYAAYERWKTQFPKLELAELPLGKDPGEALLAGVDLKAWLGKLRGGTRCPALRPVPAFRLVHSETEFEEALASLGRMPDAGKITLAVEYDAVERLLAFSDGEAFAVLLKPEQVAIDWPALQLRFALCSFDPAVLCRDIPSLSSLPPLGSVCALFHVLTGKGKEASIRKLRNNLLEHDGSLVGRSLSVEQGLAEDAHTVARLASLLATKVNTTTQVKHYKLLKQAQTALGQIMRHGLLIDWDSFEMANGMNSAKDIAAHRGDDDRVRSYCTPFTTITGRLACSGSSLQSFPNDLKHTVVAPEGRVLVDADYKQSEMRIAASLANDTELQELLSAGHDIHRETASRLFHVPAEQVTLEQRQIAKAVNFGFLFGQRPKGLRKSLEAEGIPYTLEASAELLNGFVRSYPLLYEWQRSLRNDCRTVDRSCRTFPPTGIRTALGRRIPVYTLHYAHETKIVNYAVQGSGAELTLLVLGMLPERLVGLDAKIIHCIHDEFLLEAAEDDAEQAATILAQTMTDAFAMLFPGAPTGHLLDCGIGKTWAEAKA